VGSLASVRMLTHGGSVQHYCCTANGPTALNRDRKGTEMGR